MLVVARLELSTKVDVDDETRNVDPVIVVWVPQTDSMLISSHARQKVEAGLERSVVVTTDTAVVIHSSEVAIVGSTQLNTPREIKRFIVKCCVCSRSKTNRLK